MLTIYGPQDKTSRFCDGQSRRDFLKIGGMVMGGLALPQLLAAEARAGIGKSHKAIINIFLPGGPPHQDMWDL
ncbi:MAG: twin-arginine translocation signal domain-containing protein, partial [Pirellulaceae bacterium]|nr:twin-arginine translocation signal domain-containing protein [Pirellulaceae bacterium]